ncbi:MAG: hypothetical protein H7318_00820 [Oligoflexus sp.]|nr:hypothetical protein [Oligoflexus sp.]
MRNIKLVFATIALSILIFFSSKPAHAETFRLEIATRALDSQLTTELAGRTYQNHTMGTLYSLGLDTRIDDRTSLDLSLGFTEPGEDKEHKYQDSLVKIMPRYSLYVFSLRESIYGSAGLAVHHFKRAGKNFEGYGAVAGVGIRHENQQGFGFALDASYEKSLFVQTHKIEGIRAKNRYSALELGATLSYGF